MTKKLESMVKNFTSISMNLDCSCGKPVATLSLRKHSEKHEFYAEHNFFLRFRKVRDKDSEIDFRIRDIEELTHLTGLVESENIEELQRQEIDGRKLRRLLEEYGFCKECNQIYCSNHYSTKVIEPGQGSSSYESTCPKGHKWIWYE